MAFGTGFVIVFYWCMILFILSLIGGVVMAAGFIKCVEWLVERFG